MIKYGTTWKCVASSGSDTWTTGEGSTISNQLVGATTCYHGDLSFGIAQHQGTNDELVSILMEGTLFNF